jgi:hypothetical protein
MSEAERAAEREKLLDKIRKWKEKLLAALTDCAALDAGCALSYEQAIAIEDLGFSMPPPLVPKGTKVFGVEIVPDPKAVAFYRAQRDRT